MAIRSPYAVPCEGEYGLPHRRARRFAMTRVFGGAVRVGGGVRAPRPTEGGKGVRCRRVVGDADPYGGQESAACVERRHTWVPPYKG